MISFDKIDERIDRLGKNRTWLAEVTGRSPDSIRVALAPNAPPKNRSKLLQKALSDAIEAEESRQQSPSERILPPGHVEFILSDAQYRKAKAASQIAGYASFSDFCRIAIEEEADRIMRREAAEPPSTAKTIEQGDRILRMAEETLRRRRKTQPASDG